MKRSSRLKTSIKKSSKIKSETTPTEEFLKRRRQRRPHPLQRFKCPNEKCDRIYVTMYSLARHREFECQLPPRYKCGYCPFLASYEDNVVRHCKNCHKDKIALVIDSKKTTKKEEKR